MIPANVATCKSVGGVYSAEVFESNSYTNMLPLHINIAHLEFVWDCRGIINCFNDSFFV